MTETMEEVEPGARPIVWHAGAFVAVNALLAVAFFVNKGRMVMAEINGIFDYWPIWIHLGWGLILLGHFVLSRRRARQLGPAT